MGLVLHHKQIHNVVLGNMPEFHLISLKVNIAVGRVITLLQNLLIVLYLHQHFVF